MDSYARKPTTGRSYSTVPQSRGRHHLLRRLRDWQFTLRRVERPEQSWPASQDRKLGALAHYPQSESNSRSSACPIADLGCTDTFKGRLPNVLSDCRASALRSPLPMTGLSRMSILASCQGLCKQTFPVVRPSSCLSPGLAVLGVRFCTNTPPLISSHLPAATQRNRMR